MAEAPMGQREAQDLQHGLSSIQGSPLRSPRSPCRRPRDRLRRRVRSESACRGRVPLADAVTSPLRTTRTLSPFLITSARQKLIDPNARLSSTAPSGRDRRRYSPVPAPALIVMLAPTVTAGHRVDHLADITDHRRLPPGQNVGNERPPMCRQCAPAGQMISICAVQRPTVAISTTSRCREARRPPEAAKERWLTCEDVFRHLPASATVFRALANSCPTS